jgi:hypothetical protein
MTEYQQALPMLYTGGKSVLAQTIQRHSPHRKYVYSGGGQEHASFPGRWHTYHQQQLPAPGSSKKQVL